VPDGKSAIARLQANGAAAGFEYAAKPEYQDRVFDRFAQILEDKYRRDGLITVTHRYYAGIARK
jgi:hypothetical protein